MQCDTCKQESEIILRVAVAKDYNRILARPLFNCPSCFEKKEHTKKVRGSRFEAEGKHST